MLIINVNMKTQSLPAGPLDSDRVVAFDFETTGLDPRRDEIIEAGVVRLQAGETVIFQQLYHPSIPIPDFITQLTGITQQDCQGQPELQSELPELLSRLEGQWLVAHNAPFDRGFLKAACKQADLPFKGIDGRLIDTLTLARLLLPWQPSHRLGAMTEYFNIELTDAHRAGHDALATAHLFFHLVQRACTMNTRAFARARTLTHGADDGLRLLFDRIGEYRQSQSIQGVPSQARFPVNKVGGRPGSSLDLDSPRLMDLETVLGPVGLMSERWPQFEYRAPQLAMAQAVQKAFKQDQFLVAEAGTGVGKTVAYLLPALDYAMKHQCRVVVATHTKTLQDQIFSKDLPALEELLGGGFTAVLLKGRQNYLCQRRLDKLTYAAKSRLTVKQRDALLPLILWAEETETGDIEENNGFSKERNLDLWSQLHSDGRHCMGALCEHYNSCFYQKVRRAARQAHMVLINHALLFADIVTGHHVLGEYTALIVDESHQIERAATDSLAVVIHEWAFIDMVDKLLGRTARQGGLLDWIFDWLREKKLPAPRKSDYEKRLHALTEWTSEMKSAAQALFQAMAHHGALTRLGPMDKYRIRNRSEFFSHFEDELDDLKAALDKLYDDAVTLSSWLDTDADLADPDGLDYARQIEGVVQDVLGVRERLALIVEGQAEEDICWAEVTPARFSDTGQVSLRAVPLDIAKLLADQLYPGVERCIMTSATLSIGGRFDYAKSRMGLHLLDGEQVVTKLFGSPFEYESQVRFFVPPFMPSPKSPQFTPAVSRLLMAIFEEVHRGSMVLFTSYKMLKEVYEAVKPTLSAKGVTLLGQSIDGSRSQLLKRFRDEHSSVLFGTASFWEGVDVPGAALELLVLTKIPFDVPSEPVVEARTEAVQERTGSGFMNFAVPEAIVKVRQGFGRLIRSGQDHGAVLLLDPRVTQTRYGRLFLEALPVPAQKPATVSALIGALNEWYK